MNTTFIIDGGAGRVISAIPALERYHQNNPHDDFKVLISAFADLYDFHPVLCDRTYNADAPGTFKKHILDNRVVSPEPYRLYEYYHDKVSLAKAFDLIINKDQAKEPIKPDLYVDYEDEGLAIEMFRDLKMQTGLDKVVVIQPFGHACGMYDGVIRDPSNRSLQLDTFNQLVDELSGHAIVIYFGPHDLWMHTNRKSLVFNGISLRAYMSLIGNSDYFIGCDSVGQHMARAFNKKGLLVMGATLESNVSYPNYERFKFYRKPNTQPMYMPIRFNQEDEIEADKYNSDLMNFTEQEVSDIIKIAFEDLNVG